MSEFDERPDEVEHESEELHAGDYVHDDADVHQYDEPAPAARGGLNAKQKQLLLVIAAVIVFGVGGFFSFVRPMLRSHRPAPIARNNGAAMALSSPDSHSSAPQPSPLPPTIPVDSVASAGSPAVGASPPSPTSKDSFDVSAAPAATASLPHAAATPSTLNAAATPGLQAAAAEAVAQQHQDASAPATPAVDDRNYVELKNLVSSISGKVTKIDTNVRVLRRQVSAMDKHVRAQTTSLNSILSARLDAFRDALMAGARPGGPEAVQAVAGQSDSGMAQVTSAVHRSVLNYETDPDKAIERHEARERAAPHHSVRGVTPRGSTPVFTAAVQSEHAASHPSTPAAFVVQGDPRTATAPSIQAGLPDDPSKSYRLAGMTPGHAWMVDMSQPGRVYAVVVGDKVPGHGTVTSIDVTSGVLTTSTGASFKAAAANS